MAPIWSQCDRQSETQISAWAWAKWLRNVDDADDDEAYTDDGADDDTDDDNDDDTDDDNGDEPIWLCWWYCWW